MKWARWSFSAGFSTLSLEEGFLQWLFGFVSGSGSIFACGLSGATNRVNAANWKRLMCHTVSSYAETAFPQNFHTRKLGEITAFYAVSSTNHDLKRYRRSFSESSIFKENLKSWHELKLMENIL